MGNRRFSRELALKFLYQYEFNADHVEEQMEVFLERVSSKDAVKEFMRELVYKVLLHQKEIDELLKKYSEHWTLDRMTVIDRNILRLGVSELMYARTTPPKVAINEAVEIAKKYGSRESPDFINGILDKVFKEIAKDVAPSSLG
ncbi:MAG: transcription antitermination factor NusB [Nitrospinaceae bacterium]